MDPITQGLLGASLPQSIAKKQHLYPAGALGFLAGMSPDLDVLIRSSTDPLLFLEFHRQFTHSLFFIPIGSLICALVLHPLIAKRRGLSFQSSWFYCALGYGTHALLDAYTSYGTQLLWPLTDERYAWSYVSVIDPLVTLPVLLLVVVGLVRQSAWYSRTAILWIVVYLTVGSVQHNRAEEEAWQLAKQREHLPTRVEVKPTFANILLWKVVYEAEENYYVDAIRLGKHPKVYLGESIPKLNVGRAFPWLDLESQQAKDIERFRHFSNDYLAQDPNNELGIFDVRYSIEPNKIDALWSIELFKTATVSKHVQYQTHRDTTPELRERFVEMLRGE